MREAVGRTRSAESLGALVAIVGPDGVGVRDEAPVLVTQASLERLVVFSELCRNEVQFPAARGVIEVRLESGKTRGFRVSVPS